MSLLIGVCGDVDVDDDDDGGGGGGGDVGEDDVDVEEAEEVEEVDSVRSGCTGCLYWNSRAGVVFELALALELVGISIKLLLRCSASAIPLVQREVVFRGGGETWSVVAVEPRPRLRPPVPLLHTSFTIAPSVQPEAQDGPGRAQAICPGLINRQIPHTARSDQLPLPLDSFVIVHQHVKAANPRMVDLVLFGRSKASLDARARVRVRVRVWVIDYVGDPHDSLRSISLASSY
ncbi:hypothetical protein BDN71DRAFT_1509550 [Pleurotus eryngii]|uniref:Uncharacterized protein n=1 Tax=Pleurotus eryngii TaxID=5323 RepID=A0A9P5ZV24_PLEER|nr:hypothetical protein BDN71DRAFT_1509550 [Pleurotus eryngii]